MEAENKGVKATQHMSENDIPRLIFIVPDPLITVTHLLFSKEVWFIGQHGQSYMKHNNAIFLQKNIWGMGTLFIITILW